MIGSISCQDTSESERGSTASPTKKSTHSIITTEIKYSDNGDILSQDTLSIEVFDSSNTILSSKEFYNGKLHIERKYSYFDDFTEINMLQFPIIVERLSVSSESNKMKYHVRKDIETNTIISTRKEKGDTLQVTKYRLNSDMKVIEISNFLKNDHDTTVNSFNYNDSGDLISSELLNESYENKYMNNELTSRVVRNVSGEVIAKDTFERGNNELIQKRFENNQLVYQKCTLENHIMNTVLGEEKLVLYERFYLNGNKIREVRQEFQK